jgi:hypothetical protein
MLDAKGHDGLVQLGRREAPLEQLKFDLIRIAQPARALAPQEIKVSIAILIRGRLGRIGMRAACQDFVEAIKAGAISSRGHPDVSAPGR